MLLLPEASEAPITQNDTIKSEAVAAGKSYVTSAAVAVNTDPGIVAERATRMLENCLKNFIFVIAWGLCDKDVWGEEVALRTRDGDAILALHELSRQRVILRCAILKRHQVMLYLKFQSTMFCLLLYCIFRVLLERKKIYEKCVLECGLKYYHTVWASLGIFNAAAMKGPMRSIFCTKSQKGAVSYQLPEC